MEPLTVRFSLHHRLPEPFTNPEISTRHSYNQNLTNVEPFTVRGIELSLNHRIPEPFPIPETSASRLPPPSYNEAMNNDQNEEKDEPPTYSESCSITISETDS